MKTRYYIVLILTLVFATACEDYLDRPPLDQIDNESYWKSAVDLQNYTAQFYQNLPGHQNSIYTEGLESNDDFTFRNTDDLLNGQVVINTGSWQSDFSAIRGINIFFDNYQKCEDDFQIWKQYLGEAQFFKAWSYFSLVQKYGDVPWYTHALTPDEEAELQRPRDARTVVVDSILGLLNEAAQNVDFRDEAPWNNNSINKEAVLAFTTRVALYEATWQKYHKDTPFGTAGADSDKYFQASVNAAEELMSGNYNVGIYNTGNPDTDYFELFGLGDMGPVNEILLYRAYNATERIGHNQNYYTATAPNQIGATWSYISTFLGVDGAPFDYLDLAETSKGVDFLTEIAANCDPRLKQSIWIPGDLMNSGTGVIFNQSPIFEANTQNNSTGFQIKKFNNLNTTADYANANDAGYILFSYSEVLLNYAEAKYELDGTVAYDQLNLLRARVGMPDFMVNPQSADPNVADYGYSISDELYEIRRERRVEKAFEQLRQEDWKRWAAHSLFAGKRPLGYPFNESEFPGENPILNENGLIDVLQNEIPNGYGFRPGQDYLNSVPESELTLNPSLTQNPGW
ncbi:RagB/SusD family nutrient uptake outer membrane protein [Kriegella aquimaris]|uniref:Starch-binding associating with outer membrane n=1 Tax=Kriegella aquimaris TaxID=192904 RepID=A0A1G9VH93_9FLAO|nr:RagB/SusD family nutrient uptake outer membrane protein [Kriegella aquimaris]SDM71443.1 Starch-binding associating with outer membrane [Kriegella aquimaris]